MRGLFVTNLILIVVNCYLLWTLNDLRSDIKIVKKQYSTVTNILYDIYTLSSGSVTQKLNFVKDKYSYLKKFIPKYEYGQSNNNK